MKKTIIRKERNNALFENIKQNSEGWKIREIYEISPGTPYARGINEKTTYLVHSSIKIKYDSQGILITNPQKIIRKSQFTNEQWAELEQMLQSQQQQSRVEQTTTIPDLTSPFFAVLVISSIALLLWWLILKKKKS